MGKIWSLGKNLVSICIHLETPDEKIFAIKAMNCPGCVQVFNQGLKSYRDLPLKLSEFGKVHSYEPSGALHGLLRVRALLKMMLIFFVQKIKLQKKH